MREEDIQLLFKRHPFVPLRFIMTDGTYYDIYHPDGAAVYRSRVEVGVGEPSADYTNRMHYLAMIHIIRIEELPPPGALTAANGAPA